LSIAGVFTKGQQDAAELLSNAFGATSSLRDDIVCIRSIGKNIALGLLGRSVSLGQRLHQAKENCLLVGTLPVSLEFIDNCLSGNDGSEVAIPCCLNELKEAFAPLDGGYAAIVALASNLFGMRDPLGQHPLFSASTSSLTVLSSSRKILWALADNEPQVHLGGTMTHFSSQTVRSYRIRNVCPPDVPMGATFEEASASLSELILNSVRTAVGSAKRVGVLFSGGLDSSVIASVAKLLGLETCLYTAAFRDADRLLQAEETARMLELDLEVSLVSEDETAEALGHAVWAAESSDPLQVSVAFPLDVAAQSAVRAGETVLLSGSGADELFGGYARYTRILGESGEKELSERMYRDLLRLGETDLLRDGAIGESNRIRLHAPFLNLRLVDFALGLPLAFKVGGSGDSLRKIILRESAKRLNMPAEVACSPKKAAQYSSGSQKALRRLAGNVDIRVQEYLDSILVDLRREIAERMRRVSR